MEPIETELINGKQVVRVRHHGGWSGGYTTPKIADIKKLFILKDIELHELTFTRCTTSGSDFDWGHEYPWTVDDLKITFTTSEGIVVEEKVRRLVDKYPIYADIGQPQPKEEKPVERLTESQIKDLTEQKKTQIVAEELKKGSSPHEIMEKLNWVDDWRDIASCPFDFELKDLNTSPVEVANAHYKLLDDEKVLKMNEKQNKLEEENARLRLAIKKMYEDVMDMTTKVNQILALSSQSAQMATVQLSEFVATYRGELDMINAASEGKIVEKVAKLQKQAAEKKQESVIGTTIPTPNDSEYTKWRAKIDNAMKQYIDKGINDEEAFKKALADVGEFKLTSPVPNTQPKDITEDRVQFSPVKKEIKNVSPFQREPLPGELTPKVEDYDTVIKKADEMADKNMVKLVKFSHSPVAEDQSTMFQIDRSVTRSPLVYEPLLKTIEELGNKYIKEVGKLDGSYYLTAGLAQVLVVVDVSRKDYRSAKLFIKSSIAAKETGLYIMCSVDLSDDLSKIVSIDVPNVFISHDKEKITKAIIGDYLDGDKASLLTDMTVPDITNMIEEINKLITASN